MLALIGTLLCGGAVLKVFMVASSVLRAVRGGKPVRVDLWPIPVDLVLVSAPAQIQAMKADPGFARLHAVPTRDLPLWARLYIRGTRFYDAHRDQWFAVFEPDTADSAYAARRAAIVDRLGSLYSRDDVVKIAGLLRAGADDDALAAAWVPLVCSRLIGGRAVPPDITRAARSCLNTPADILRYPAAVAASAKVNDFCAAASPNPPLLPIDIASNIGSSANSLPGAFRALYNNPRADIEELFTRAKNCPTQAVPRVAIAKTTFGGLLEYATRPNETVILVQLAKAAEKSGSLYYTFGTGTEARACAFLPYFKAFMTDLQKELAKFVA